MKKVRVLGDGEVGGAAEVDAAAADGAPVAVRNVERRQNASTDRKHL